LAEFPINFIYALGIFCKTFIILVFARFIFSIILEIVEEYSKYKKFTYIDTLTNVYNRRKFEEIINEIIESEYVPKFSLVLFDVDSFKKINDTYGHSSGDYVLKELCYLIEKYLREWEENGQLFRYGGDEFFIIFRNRSGIEVQEIMNKVIQKVAE
uniref:GGDEF domain-containing protein n=1 Tax=Lactococcus petauri TaxID=1940789 RepID=UPI00254B6A07